MICTCVCPGPTPGGWIQLFMPIHDLHSRLRRAFPALHHRNFRLFWTGQCVSLIGTWMQNIGQAWPARRSLSSWPAGTIS